jgi:iron(III) transport system permease protein
MPQSRARTPLAWWLLGSAAFVLLPWYLPQDLSLWQSLPGVFGAADTASGLVQALSHGRPWLWLAPAALLGAGIALCMTPGRAQGRVMVVTAGLGLAGLLMAGFAIGAKGWAFVSLEHMLGAAPGKQFGVGIGGATTLVALLMLLGIGVARLGAFRGDLFVGCAVLLCAALLLLFVALPVAQALAGAWLDDAGRPSISAWLERMAGERVWGLGCLAGGVRCGVAWNTLFLALLTAGGTTLLGTLIALMAERGSKRWTKPLQVLALLPIITPPFVVGLGLILLFGRAGLVNQGLEWAFGVTPSRWFYGLFGVWLAQMFAFTPVAFMIMRGVVQGVSPSLEEAAQTLRADRMATFRTVTLPLMKPGLANAFLVGFIESMADFGNPVVVGGQYSVLSTDIFFAVVGAQFDQGRAASLALLLTAFALTVFFIQKRVLGRAAYTTVSGKGDAGVPMPLPATAKRLCLGVALPWLAFTVVIYVFAFIGGFVRTWGRDYTPTLAHLITAFDLQWGSHGLVWAGTAWNSLFTTVKLAAIAAPLAAALGLLIAWLLART